MKKRIRNFEIKFFQGVTKRSPNYVDALIPLAEAYTKEGLYEEGLEVDKKLARLEKDDSNVHYNLACSYALTKQPEKAIEALKHAISLGYEDFRHMRKDKDLVSLHGTKSFESLFPPKKK